MRSLPAFTFLLIFVASAAAQGGAPPRRSLDSLDLISVPKRAPIQPSVYVDRETYQVLAPLTRVSREVETEYERSLSQSTTEQDEMLAWTARKVTVIQRSMLILEETDRIPKDVSDVLTKDFELLANINRVIGAIRFAKPNAFQAQIDELKKQYGTATLPLRLDGSEVTDREALILSMIRRVNADLATIKPVS